MSTKAKINISILVILAVLGGLFSIGISGFGLLSGLRAYVSGEGLWAKAQQNAIHQLNEYIFTGEEIHYQSFLEQLKVPLGDNVARLELDKPNQVYEIIFQGLERGGNNPKDIPSLIFLYKHFKNIKQFSNAIEQWKVGDSLISQLITVGEDIHRQINLNSMSKAQISLNRSVLRSLQEGLIEAEIKFSENISEAARWAENLLIVVMLFFSVAGGIISFIVLYLLSNLAYELKEKNSLLEIQAEKETVISNELKEKADSLQHMLLQIQESTTSIDNLNKEIIERKQIEEKLRMSRIELETAYNDLKNTQVQMLQREKMASLGQLAAGVAHEINNPMGFITSNLGILSKYVDELIGFTNYLSKILVSLGAEDKIKDARKKDEIDLIIKDSHELLEESLDGARRVAEIVQNLKNFSRIDEAKITETDINECLDVTLKIIWNELKYKAKIHKEYGELPQTHCNSQEIKQVFLNLLVNASHAIEDKGDITIRTWAKDGFINVSISDMGHGIAKDIIDKIYDPFFTTKKVGKGAGLGLSICYDIIKKHEGKMNVESEIGLGTTFTVSLPVKGKEP